MEPTREEVDGWRGRTLLEFGASWCPICQRARPHIDAALEQAELRHVRVEDGRGRPLGRTFQVKLWPTLVLLEDGREIGRVVRPTDGTAIRQLLAGT